MKGLFIPEITAEMFRNGCLESIEALMAEGEIYDIDYSPWIPVSKRLPEEEGLYLVYTEEQPFVCSFEDGEFFIDEVLAWMPLPEPYGEDKGVLEQLAEEQDSLLAATKAWSNAIKKNGYVN